MIKKELIKEIFKTNNLTKAEVDTFIKTTFEVIKQTVSNGESVTLVGFGTFSMKLRKGRIVKIPTTGKEIKIKTKKVVKFEPGKAFKNVLNKTRKTS